jgi:hypothetical protein
MVVNNMKFTRHYYMGSLRVVSKLGEMGSHQDMLKGAAPVCAALQSHQALTIAAPESAAILRC